MRNLLLRPAFAGIFMLVLPATASAEGGWFSGNWYLEVGAAGFTAPRI